MKNIPSALLKELSPQGKVIWWGHPQTFEVVEELCVGAYRALVVWFIAEVIWSIGKGAFDPFWYLTFTIGAILIVMSVFWWELARWKNEIYGVTMDDNGGGRLYKIWGFPAYNRISEKISDSTIAPDYRTPVQWRIWGYLTGQQMEIVTVHSAKHGMFIQGRKMSPGFSRAINAVIGAPPQRKEFNPGKLDEALLLKDLMIYGLIDKTFAKEAARKMIARAVLE